MAVTRTMRHEYVRGIQPRKSVPRPARSEGRHETARRRGGTARRTASAKWSTGEWTGKPQGTVRLVWLPETFRG
jgi:hypothetical protein